jgi:hypothetical protein
MLAPSAFRHWTLVSVGDFGVQVNSSAQQASVAWQLAIEI